MRKLILVLFIFGLAFSASSGTTTMQWPGTAAFKFSDGQPVSIAVAQQEIDPQAVYDIIIEPWNKPAWCVNYLDTGVVKLDDLNLPSTSVFSDDGQGFLGCSEVLSGHAYWIKTRTGKIAKVKVTSAQYLGVDPKNGHTNKIVFDWVYYGDGLPSNAPSKDSNTIGGSENLPCVMTIVFLLLPFGAFLNNLVFK